MFVIANGLWLAYIVMNIIHGRLQPAFDGIIMATLCMLCYVATKRMERLAKINAMLAEELQRLKDVKYSMEYLRTRMEIDRMEPEVTDEEKKKD